MIGGEGEVNYAELNLIGYATTTAAPPGATPQQGAAIDHHHYLQHPSHHHHHQLAGDQMALKPSVGKRKSEAQL